MGVHVDDIYEHILDLRRHGGQAVLVTVVEKEGSAPAPPGAKRPPCAGGTTVGTVGGGGLEHAAVSQAAQLLDQKGSQLIKYSLLENGRVADAEPLGMLCGGTISLFYEYLGYEAYVYIFGAGHVSRTLAPYMKNMRCYVTVVDDRPEVIPHMEGAHRVLTADYGSALEEETVPEGAYFVIGTPSHQADYEVLKRIFTSDWKPRYVGMLASKRKARTLIQRLVEESDDEVNMSVLYSPVGLDLGGRSPDEIAIAIAAEIQALRYGKEGHKHMRGQGSLLKGIQAT